MLSQFKSSFILAKLSNQYCVAASSNGFFISQTECPAFYIIVSARENQQQSSGRGVTEGMWGVQSREKAIV